MHLSPTETDAVAQTETLIRRLSANYSPDIAHALNVNLGARTICRALAIRPRVERDRAGRLDFFSFSTQMQEHSDFALIQRVRKEFERRHHIVLDVHREIFQLLRRSPDGLLVGLDQRISELQALRHALSQPVAQEVA